MAGIVIAGVVVGAGIRWWPSDLRLGWSSIEQANWVAGIVAAVAAVAGTVITIVVWRQAKVVEILPASESARTEDKIDGAVGSGEPAGGGLPGGTPDFTGRQQMLDELARRVQAHDPTGSVVAIHAVDGMAGVGKTELALRAAHQHKHHYPDGQYFVNLHGYTAGIPPMSPEDALEELLRQVGVTKIPPDLARRQARWQAVMRSQRALVLLDNALDVAQVGPLLPDSAGTMVLITSRSQLSGLPRTRSILLDVLSKAEAVELFTRLAGRDRCGDPAAVAGVVELVGRLPVAVQAAAGQMRGDLTVAELAQDLEAAGRERRLLSELDPLGGGLWAAFGTSLQRLDETRKCVFIALGVHPGSTVGVPQLAALAGVSVSEGRSTLRALAERNLIKPSRDPLGHPRYELHDLIREFARQQAQTQLTSEQRSRAIARLTKWYATTLDSVEPSLAADRQQVRGVDIEGLCLREPGHAREWLVSEQSNLLALAEATTGIHQCHVFGRVAKHLYRLDHHAAAYSLYQKAAAGFRLNGDRNEEAAARWGLGSVARATGKYETAANDYRAALDLYHQVGNRDGAAYTLIGLGHLARLKGEYGAADCHFREALAAFKETGNRAGEASAQRGLGSLARVTGDNPAAERSYRAAMEAFEAVGDLAGEASALQGLGAVALVTGDYTAAGEAFHTALTIYRQIGSRAGEAEALYGQGVTARLTGGYGLAIRHFRAALGSNREIGNRDGEGDSWLGLGDVMLDTGDLSTARSCFLDAHAAFSTTGNRAGQASTWRGMGDAAVAGGDLEAAEEHFRAAHTAFEEMGNRARQADTWNGLGRVALAKGDYATAERCFHTAHAIHQQVGNKEGSAKALCGLGCTANGEGRRSDARRRWHTALEVYEQIGSPVAASVRQLLGGLGHD